MTKTASRNLTEEQEQIEESVDRYGRIALMAGICVGVCGLAYFAALYLFTQG